MTFRHVSACLGTSQSPVDETRSVARGTLSRTWATIAALLGVLLGTAHARAQETSTSDIDSLLAAPISGAAKYEQTVRHAAGDVTIVTADDIRNYGYRNLADVLASVRGFYVSNDRNYTYVGVRGFSRPTDYNNRILLLIDGHAMNEDVYGSAQIGSELPIDFSIVERVEIIRGPSSALYGTGGMLATVNVILKSGSTLHGGVATAEVGSFGRSGGTLAAGGELPSGVQLVGSIFGSRVDGQDLFYSEYADTPSGGVAHGLDFEKSYGGMLSASYAGFQLTGLQTVRQKGIPTGAFGNQFDTFAQTTDRHSYLELKRETELSTKLILSTRAYVSYYGYKGLYPEEPTVYDATTNNWWGGEVQARWDPTPSNRLTVGSEYRQDTRADYRWFDATHVGFSGNFPFHVFSAYVQDEYQVTPKIVLTGGLRYDQYSTGQSHTSPRLALVWDATQHSTMKLLYGEAFRVPSVYEANYADTVSASNQALTPERIETIEVSWQQTLSSTLLMSGSIYQTKMRDLIDQVIDQNSGLLMYKNQGTVRARGFELELTARLPHGASGYASYANQRAVDPRESGSLDLSNSPRQTAKAGLSMLLPAGIRAAAGVVWETGRLTVQDTRTRAFVIGNLNLEYAPPELPVRLSLRILNLFNSRWATPGGYEHVQAEIPQDGRTVAVRLEYRF